VNGEKVGLAIVRTATLGRESQGQLYCIGRPSTKSADCLPDSRHTSSGSEGWRCGCTTTGAGFVRGGGLVSGDTLFVEAQRLDAARWWVEPTRRVTRPARLDAQSTVSRLPETGRLGEARERQADLG
jgi:hypothetical protein